MELHTYAKAVSGDAKAMTVCGKMVEIVGLTTPPNWSHLFWQTTYLLGIKNQEFAE